jgi:hypothetical protein
MGLNDTIKSYLAPDLAAAQAEKLQQAQQAKTPAMIQHEYDRARRALLADFASTPATACQSCIANAKAARRKERMELVNRAIVTCPGHGASARRLRADMDEVENMRCAQHVYLANDPNAPPELRQQMPPGFLKPTPDELSAMGLNEKMLNPPGSNFRAAVYKKDPAVWGDNPKPPFVVAFRGSTPELEDWQNNFAQDANQESSYYQRAVRIGNRLARHGVKIHFVGHSMGGGLASAAQGGSGLTASTYNAAGLHPRTVARYSQDAAHRAAEAAKINALRVEGEVLTQTQESGGLSLLANEAVGIKRKLQPATTATELAQLKSQGKVAKDTKLATHLHGMDEVITAMEQQKSADEAALKSCLAGGKP